MENNLTVTGSDGRGELLWLSENAYVRQASSDYVLNGLAQCLALVVPVGMSEEDREQWLAAATVQLYEKHLSPEELDYALKKARDECDHPAKIVPAAIRALGDNWKANCVLLQSDSNVSSIADRFETIMEKLRLGEYSQEQIDELPERAKRYAVERGYLRMVGGQFVWRAPASHRLEADA